jgi:C1A family cysteine protease
MSYIVPVQGKITMHATRTRRRATSSFLVAIATIGSAAHAAAQTTSFTLAKPQTAALTVGDSFAQPIQRIDLTAYGQVGAVAITGNVTLRGPRGFARVVLEAADGTERLVHESSVLLDPSMDTPLNAACEETCSLGQVRVSALRVETEDAELVLDEVLFASADSDQRATSLSADTSRALRLAQSTDKLRRVQERILAYGYKWQAGETSVSALSYAEKKRRMGGEMPNLYGFEYYRGGIFERPSQGETRAALATVESDYVDEFSWRSRHGQDWVTSVKNQDGCGSCWAFAATGATELAANLYFNRHLDLDLAEQDGVSCSGAGSCAGGDPVGTLRYYVAEGVVEEACFPYTATDTACNEKCETPKERVRIGGIVELDTTAPTEDALKGMILGGAVSGVVSSWTHAMALVGYKVLRAGDELFVSANGTTQTITIPEGDPLVGRSAWQFKNSWGDWGDGGYVYLVTDVADVGWTVALTTPVSSLNFTDQDIACEDVDGDGYFAWGNGQKPATCPADSPSAADGDDANACLGEMNAYGFLADICTKAPIDLGLPCTHTGLVVEGSAVLSISEWPAAWRHRRIHGMVVTFRAARRDSLSGLSVDVAGKVTPLRGKRQSILLPYRNADARRLTLTARSPRAVDVSWRIF